MSVRRLADEAVQPKSFAFTRANQAWAKETIKKYPKGRQQSAVIPLLMRAQEQEGWVTRPAIEYVAQMLDMPLIRVLEVATFYTQFQLKPVGSKAHVQVCGTTPCMLRGAEKLIEVCKKRIHHEPLECNREGTLSWEEVECQGACVNAPMVMIGRDTYEDLTPERLEEIIDAFEAGRGGEIKPGPQIDRMYSAPASGLTTLTDIDAIMRGSKTGGRTKKTGAEVPPSKAAKPKTAAHETNAAVESPSKVKVDAGAEQRQSAEPSPRPKSTAARNAKPDVAAAGNRPVAIEAPAKPDDLKLISGVGPRIERLLNGLGIYTYKQIAAWTEAERAWVDNYLNFRGRIERDNWVKQAEALAKGGVAEYEKVFGKKPR